MKHIQKIVIIPIFDFDGKPNLVRIDSQMLTGVKRLVDKNDEFFKIDASKEDTQEAVSRRLQIYSHISPEHTQMEQKPSAL